MKTPRGRVREGVTVEPTDPASVPWSLEVPAGAQSTFGTNIMTIVRDPAESSAFGPNLVEWDNNGGLSVFSSAGLPAVWVIEDGDISEAIQIQGRGLAIASDSPNTDEPEAIWVNDSVVVGSDSVSISFYKTGMLKFSGVVPADAAIGNGKCFMYFDPTNGAAKVKWKGKTLNGTVVTGQVALA